MLGMPNIEGMGSSFLITLREGLEASLILAILLTYLKKTGRWADARYVWSGTATAVGVCLVAGIAIFVALDGLNGKVEYAVEGFIALFAMAVLTHMIFWMRSHARTLGKELRDKVDESVGSALAIIAFAAVAREGLETVLFLLSAETESASGSQVVVGGVIGLVLSIIIGFAVYRSGNRLNLRTFFNVTAVLLLLFAAGLAGKAVHELRELIGWESGWLVSSAWSLESGVWATGTFYDFMRGLFGWHRSPENIRVIAYFAYLVPVVALYLRGDSDGSPAPTDKKDVAQVA
ncbi:iron permease [Actinomycetes bacterium]|jgi:high-affinity iron transporter|nr:iron permease [Actinomycetes bacterium]